MSTGAAPYWGPGAAEDSPRQSMGTAETSAASAAKREIVLSMNRIPGLFQMVEVQMVEADVAFQRYLAVDFADPPPFVPGFIGRVHISPGIGQGFAQPLNFRFPDDAVFLRQPAPRRRIRWP